MKKILLLIICFCFFSAYAEIYNLTRNQFPGSNIDFYAYAPLSLPAGEYHIKLISGSIGSDLEFWSGTGDDNKGTRYTIFGPGTSSPGNETDITVVAPVTMAAWGWGWGTTDITLEITGSSQTCVPPLITSPLAMTIEAGQSASYTITATGTNPQLGVVEEQLYDWSTGSYYDPVILFSPPADLPPGDYQFFLVANNDCGSDSKTLTLTVTAPGTGSSGKVDTDDDVPAINEAKVAIVSAITELKTINTSIKNSVTNIENDVSSIKSSVSSIDTEIKQSNVFLEEIRDLLTPDETEDPIPSTENEIPEISIPDVEDNSNIDLDTSKFFDGKFGQLRGTLTEKGSEALSLTIPVSQLLPSLGGTDRLDDWVLNFAAEPLSDWVFLCRSFLLGVLYLGTIFATVRILRTFEF